MRYFVNTSKVLVGDELEENVMVLVDEETGKILEVMDSFASEITHIPVENFGENTILIPAFYDTHTHLAQYGLNRSKPNLNAFTSKKDVLDFINDFVRKYHKDIYIFVDYDESKWIDESYINREDLDSISEEKPIVLRRICGHKAILNSKAMEIVGDVEGLDPETGEALEYLPLNMDSFFPPSEEEIEQAIMLAQEEALSMGIVYITDITSVRHFKAYQRLKNKGKLKLRVNILLYEKHLNALVESGIMHNFGSDELKVSGIKIFLDGSVGAGTHDLLLKSDEELYNILKVCEDNGLQLSAHAIGTKAISQFLNVLERFSSMNVLRHRMEHFEFPTKEDVSRASKLNVLVSVQPNFVHQWGGFDGMYAKKLDKQTLSRCNPYREMLEEGVHFAFGTDNMPFSVEYVMKGALEHFLQEQRLTLEQALYRFTTSGYHFSFHEKTCGRIAPGYRADLVVLDESTYRPKAIILDGKFLQTAS